MKISGNSFCPCGSQKKYKKCCREFHYDESNIKSALELMKARYSAYAANEAKFIINTTHKENSEFTNNTDEWEKSIHSFCEHTDFKNLEILDYQEGDEISYITFKAEIYQGAIDASFVEKSKFVKDDEKWLYHSGEFIDK